MNWHNIKLLIWKDWRIGGRNRYIKFLLLLIIGWALALPIFAIVGINLHTIKLDLMAPMMPVLKSSILFFSVIFSIGLVSDIFVGEKERRTILSLLALPCTDLEILLSKILVPLLLTMVIPGIFFTSITLSLEIASYVIQGITFFDAGWYLTWGVLSPLVALGYILFGARISSRFKTFMVSSNVLMFFTLPFIVLPVITFMVPLPWDMAFILTLIAICTCVDLGLYFGSGKVMNREKLILDLD